MVFLESILTLFSEIKTARFPSAVLLMSLDTIVLWLPWQPLSLRLPLIFFSAVLRAVSQFAAAGTASGVRLHEELHLHHRETLRPLQSEVGGAGCF